MAGAIDVLLTLAIPALVLIHLLAAPYTKVEESFNIQAIHDILTYGVPSPLDSDAVEYIKANYDHVSFPGSVPRTFAGATILAGLARPFVRFLTSPEQVQLLVRAILGLVNAAALIRFRSAVDVAYGKTAGRFYLAFVACQFQLLFYASRTLPNYLVLPLTTEASRALLLALSTSPKLRPSSKRRRLCLYLLTVSGIIFRSELALLLATTTAVLLLFSGLKVRSELIPAVFAGALVALPLTLGLDTFFWRPKIALSFTYQTTLSTYQIPLPTWPELQAFIYNTIQGHSSDWGTSPMHYYFSTALPKLLLNPLHLLLVPASLTVPAIRRTSLLSLLPSLLFITLFSLLPHKEPRFIIYALPLLLASSASAASYTFTRRAKTTAHRLLSSALLLSLPLSFLAASATLYVSCLNYPGGVALAELHALSSPTSGANSTASTVAAQALRRRGVVVVHLDDLACQTGVTRFQETRRSEQSASSGIEETGQGKGKGKGKGTGKGQKGKGTGKGQKGKGKEGKGDGNKGAWVYDKTEAQTTTLLLRPDFWAAIDFVITERPDKVAGGAWDVAGAVWAFDGIGVRVQSSGSGSSGEKGTRDGGREGQGTQDGGGEGQGPQLGEKDQKVHEVQDTRALFFPEFAGKWVGDWVEGVARRVAGWNGGWWPHVRLRKRLYILQRGRMGM